MHPFLIDTVLRKACLIIVLRRKELKYLLPSYFAFKELILVVDFPLKLKRDKYMIDFMQLIRPVNLLGNYEYYLVYAIITL
jgi:hypothetical protein